MDTDDAYKCDGRSREHKHPNDVPLTEKQIADAYHHWWFRSFQGAVDRVLEKTLRGEGPRFDWLELSRTALNLATTEVGDRLQMSRAAVRQTEKRETEGHITVKTLIRYANAMNCDFIYAIKPMNGSFARTVWQTVFESAVRDPRLQKAPVHLKFQLLKTLVEARLESIIFKQGQGMTERRNDAEKFDETIPRLYRLPVEIPCPACGHFNEQDWRRKSQR